MINFKSFNWGYGLIASVVLGLSGCSMDGTNPQTMDYPSQGQMHTNTHTGAAKAKNTGSTAKGYASKEPTQKATPGPKRTAAPQLPVIQ